MKLSLAGLPDDQHFAVNLVVISGSETQLYRLMLLDVHNSLKSIFRDQLMLVLKISENEIKLKYEHFSLVNENNDINGVQPTKSKYIFSQNKIAYN